jgi:hypothetical protein
MAEHPPSKDKALSTNPSTVKSKNLKVVRNQKK